MAGWYELSKAKDGQYRFVLKAGNGEVILTSELYKAKALPKMVLLRYKIIVLMRLAMKN